MPHRNAIQEFVDRLLEEDEKKKKKPKDDGKPPIPDKEVTTDQVATALENGRSIAQMVSNKAEELSKTIAKGMK